MSEIELTEKEKIIYEQFQDECIDKHFEEMEDEQFGFLSGKFDCIGNQNLISNQRLQIRLVHALQDEFGSGFQLYATDFFNDDMSNEEYFRGLNFWLEFSNDKNIVINRPFRNHALPTYNFYTETLDNLNITINVENVTESQLCAVSSYIDRCTIKYIGNNSIPLQLVAVNANFIIDCSKVNVQRITDADLQITDNVKEFYINPDYSELRTVLGSLIFKKHEVITNQFTINTLRKHYGEDTV